MWARAMLTSCHWPEQQLVGADARLVWYGSIYYCMKRSQSFCFVRSLLHLVYILNYVHVRSQTNRNRSAAQKSILRVCILCAMAWVSGQNYTRLKQLRMFSVINCTDNKLVFIGILTWNFCQAFGNVCGLLVNKSEISSFE